MKRWQTFILAMILTLPLMPVDAANTLAHSPSPYLALHGNDPVDWRNWDQAALEKARKEDRLIFVSVGYYACHWCHVMQRESFSDTGIAAALNRDFVSIKVDRELNPALDNRLMAFVQATTGRGGWPMNVFLTPDGYPIMGLTYAPPGRFERIVTGLQERWKHERDALEKAAREVDEVLAGQRLLEDRILEDKPVAAWQQALPQALMKTADTLKGGFGNRAKFPSIPQLWALLELGDGEEVEEFLQLSFDTMASQGLHDVVGGGFFRYTVDPNWETPHYEKMLYTNALLALLYFRAAERFDKPEYRRIALETLDFMQAEMTAKGGAFIASLSAVDEAGVEGGYYLWSQKQLRRYLSDEEMDLVNVGWAMNRYNDADAEVLPLQVMEPGELAAQFGLKEGELAERLGAIRSKLKRAREKARSVPRDSKRLAGWNGLALAALAEGARNSESWKQRGKQLRDFMLQRLWDGRSLSRAVDDRGRSLGAGGLEDYAFVAFGLLSWAAATGDKPALRAGHRILQQAWNRFHQPQGWLETEQTLLPTPLYQRHISDGALPSGEAMLLRATRRYLALNSDPDLEKLLSQVLSTSTQSMEEGLYWYASLVAAARPE
jgi:uncharacterized protein YyaL (SSP411 family)